MLEYVLRLMKRDCSVELETNEFFWQGSELFGNVSFWTN